MSPGQMSTEEARRAQIAIGFLSHFVPEGWRFWLDCLEKPARGSFVARAKRTQGLSQVLDVSLLLADANDHFLDVVDEFTQGYLPNFALYAVVRGAFEADAWACWLAAPGLIDKERLARVLTLRAGSLFEMRRLALPPTSKLRPGLSSAGHYRKRIKRVIAAGRRQELSPMSHKDGRLVFVELPKVTPLLRSLLPRPVIKVRYGNQVKPLTLGERTYGELSARAHATFWGLMSNVTAARRIGKFQKMGVTELDVLDFIRLLGTAVGLHNEAIKRVGMLAGLDPAIWDARRGEIPFPTDGDDRWR
jgi:hypothetical protein